MRRYFIRMHALNNNFLIIIRTDYPLILQNQQSFHKCVKWNELRKNVRVVNCTNW